MLSLGLIMFALTAIAVGVCVKPLPKARSMLPASAGRRGPAIKLNLGRIVGSRRSFEVALDDLPNNNFAVIGLSGSGKSCFARSVVNQLVEQRVAVTVIDPGGDLVEDILCDQIRYIVQSGNPRRLKRIHWFEPGNYAMAFGYDLFHFSPAKPVHPELFENAYRAWLHTTAEHISLLVQLKQGQTDFEQNARLQRVLTNILIAVGTPIDDQGRHLPLSDALILLQVDHPASRQVFARIEPFLDRDTREDFQRLYAYRRVEDRLRETESSINRLRAILGVIGRAIFSVTDRRQTVNTRQIILDGGLQLWHLKPTEYFGHDLKRTFAQFAMHEVLQAMASMPRDLRVPHVLIVDEAAEVANEELLWSLGALRRTGQSTWILGQDLSSFRKADRFDMVPKLLSQSNIFCFNQTWPDDTEILSRVLFTGNLEFNWLQQEVDRHDGYAWHQVAECSFSADQSHNWGQSDAQGAAKTIGEQSSEAIQKVQNWSLSTGNTTSHASGIAAGETNATGTSKGLQLAPIIQNGRRTGGIEVPSSGTSGSLSHNTQRTDVETRATNSAESQGGSQGLTISRAHNQATTENQTLTVSAGGAERQGAGVSLKQVPLAQVRVETRPTGNLEKAVSDQFEGFRQSIATRSKQHAIAKMLHEQKAFEFETPHVPNAFVNPTAQLRALEWAKREIYATHPYYFVPNFDPREEDRRLEQFLADAKPGTAPRPVAREIQSEQANPLL